MKLNSWRASISMSVNPKCWRLLLVSWLSNLVAQKLLIRLASLPGPAFSERAFGSESEIQCLRLFIRERRTFRAPILIETCQQRLVGARKETRSDTADTAFRTVSAD